MNSGDPGLLASIVLLDTLLTPCCVFEIVRRKVRICKFAPPPLPPPWWEFEPKNNSFNVFGVQDFKFKCRQIQCQRSTSIRPPFEQSSFQPAIDQPEHSISSRQIKNSCSQSVFKVTVTVQHSTRIRTVLDQHSTGVDPALDQFSSRFRVDFASSASV